MTNPDREELVKIADELDGWHDCADGDVSAGNGHFRVVCESDSEQQRLNLRATLREASTALRRLASSDGGVKVRELAWRRIGDCWKADRYSIRVDHGVPVYYIVSGWASGTNPCDTLDAAKVAAQADYEARIKSALVEVPAVKGEPVRWEWCCFEDNEQRTGWQCEGHGDQKGWEKLVESNPAKYRIVRRPLYTAPPADAGMREALESWLIAEIKKACERYQSGDQRGRFFYGRHSALLEVQQHVAALTAPGATTKSDGGEVITAEQMDAIENAAIAGQPLTDPFAGKVPCHCHDAVSQRLCFDKDRCYTVEAQPVQAIKMPEHRYQEPDPRGGSVSFGNYSEYTPVTVRGSTSDPSSTRSEVTVPCGLDRPSEAQCPNMKAGTSCSAISAPPAN